MRDAALADCAKGIRQPDWVRLILTKATDRIILYCYWLNTYGSARLVQMDDESVLRYTSNDDQRPGTHLSHTSKPR
jgi:hypothetical protein